MSFIPSMALHVQHWILFFLRIRFYKSRIPVASVTYVGKHCSRLAILGRVK